MSGGGGSSSGAIATEARPRLHPRLRLVHDAESPRRIPEQSHAHVLVAGANARERSRMLGELRNLLPANTRFVEADETWEVLACAAGSRMIVLTDDLRDAPADSLLRLLGRRHPGLPVLALGGRSHAGAPPDGAVASV